MQPIHASTQFTEILRIIFGPIRMDFTEVGLTQQEEDYPEAGENKAIYSLLPDLKYVFQFPLNIESFCFIICIRFHMLEPKTNYQPFRLIIGPKTNYLLFKLIIGLGIKRLQLP